MPIKYTKAFRWSARIFFLIVSILLIMAGPLPVWMLKIFQPTAGFIREFILLPTWMAKLIPALSPLSFLSSLEAHQGGRLTVLWILPPAILAAAAIFKGRFFCRWICPLGTVYSAACTKNFKKHVFKKKLSGYLFWGIIFSSAIGFPLFLLLDPLSTFSRINLVFSGSLTLASVIPGIVFPIFLIAGIIQPLSWCSHFCPLGHMVDLIHKTDVRYSERFRGERREIMTALLFSIPLAMFVKKNPLVKDEGHPLLPPGAGNKNTFSSLCTRCYACVNVCPTKILAVGFPDNADVGRWFVPEMNAYRGTCQESCNNCTQVCPTGAIKKLSFEEKHNTQLGVAQVTKSKCIAWKDGEYCMVCDEFCPYKAIDIDSSESGLARPVVNPEICRGCGICQNACPVRKNGAAIVVHGVKEQKRIGK
jgi:formate hydrogenlyase subunit 6/NADH:ubiquinone oxidoreductase subunit I